MSTIKCDKSAGDGLLLFYGLLQQKIEIICERIGFDDSGVLWIIYDPRSWYRNKIHCAVLAGTQGEDYGFAKISVNQIWISTRSILSSTCWPTTRAAAVLLQKSVKRDFLADVILDEITHIQTHCNHGDDAYERQWAINRIKYYRLI